MSAGKYDTRLVLQEQSTVQDSYGQAVLTWTDVGSLWADVRNTSGAEAIRSSADVSTVQSSVRIRYRTGMTAAMRLINGATLYNIKAILVAPRKQYIDLVCEVVNAGT